MKRKTWLAIPLILTLVVLSQSLTTPLSAVEYPAIYITPSPLIRTDLTPGKNYTISIKTNYTGNDIWGWELTLTWNPLVLNGTKVVNGDLIKEDGILIFDEGEFNNIEGKLSLTSAAALNMTTIPYTPVNSTGPGILANVTFTVVGYGDTPITLGVETKLIDIDGEDIVDARIMPDNIGHGYFRNTEVAPEHDVLVLWDGDLTTLNDTEPYYGRRVFFNVTVKNNGNVTERLAVSVYYRTISPDWLVYNETVDLESGANHTIDFVWNTTDWPRENFKITGTGNLTAVVTEVWNETNTANNKRVIGEVHIRIVGDIDANGHVETLDLITLGGIYPDRDPPPTDPDADLNNDGKIDEVDWMELCGSIGLSEPEIGY